eukprot:CAMPEP_0198574264 /NCGR_PEP_ID=MMETSP1462-20131121/114449_1 /TAXON_ID=1333877 /ORGANISM="Brandtodinium nutriculum, Strain RCC3387" /LENGTH=32 /DNA_ID= /DNA_START= /DNA_END= /DNA_ORIENTATION=
MNAPARGRTCKFVMVFFSASEQQADEHLADSP